MEVELFTGRAELFDNLLHGVVVWNTGQIVSVPIILQVMRPKKVLRMGSVIRCEFG